MSKTINGIFEPFHKYVTKQLNVRKNVISPGGNNSDTLNNLNKGIEYNNDITDIYKTKIIPYLDKKDESIALNALQEDLKDSERSLLVSNHHNLFHTFTTQKQCTIRMASGVDLRSENDILTEFEKLRLGITKGNTGYYSETIENLMENNTAYDGSSFARFWMLQGGIQMDYSDQLHFSPNDINKPKNIFNLRGGIHGEPIFREYFYADDRAYGSPILRSDPFEGYGIVPMPGITNAEITTKSEDGSLREAKVNFVCHNKRQLEVLEMLYMRPGYPIMLEWGWVPYIDNEFNVYNTEEELDAIDSFFDKNSNLEEINRKIRKQKVTTGGNYDGFVGFCKNFLFKAKEDGGYECTTEIIAHGEILESLKSPIKTTPMLKGHHGGWDYQLYIDEDIQVGKQVERNWNESDVSTRTDYSENTKSKNLSYYGEWASGEDYECTDAFLYYLKSIKANLDQAGIKAALTYDGTEYTHYGIQNTVRESVGGDLIKKRILNPNYRNKNKAAENVYYDMQGLVTTSPFEGFYTAPIGNIGYETEGELGVLSSVMGDDMWGKYYINDEFWGAQPDEVIFWSGHKRDHQYGTPYLNAGLREMGTVEQEVGGRFDIKVLEADYYLRSLQGTADNQFIYYKIPDGDGGSQVVPINHLNVVHTQYIKGYEEIKQLVKDVAKVTDKTIRQEEELWQVIPSFLKTRLMAYQGENGSMIPFHNTRGWYFGDDASTNYRDMHKGEYGDQIDDTYSYLEKDKHSSVASMTSKIKEEYNSNPMAGVSRGYIHKTEKNEHGFSAQKYLDQNDQQVTEGAPSMRDVEGLGLQSLLSGTILKEFSLEDETSTDSGIRKKIFVRWDLICQILNRLTTPRYKKDRALVELTYLTRDTPTFREGEVTQDLNGDQQPDPKFLNDEDGDRVVGSYIPYSIDTTNHELPLYGADSIGKSNKDLGIGDAWNDLDADQQTDYNNKVLDVQDENLGGKVNRNNGTVTYPPILGRSFDRNICLMPHQIPNMQVSMIKKDTFYQYYDKDFNIDPKTGKSKGKPMFDWDKVYLPSGEQKRYEGWIYIEKNFTSFWDIKTPINAIGNVYFNLDYLITTYESRALEEYSTTNKTGNSVTKKRNKDEFSMHDYITEIWDGVNSACGGFYDFGLHVEHERPHVARIVDFTMNGGSADLDDDQPIFEFNPQSIHTITRDSSWQSKLDNDFASTISIAAQAPNDINSLDAVSFKAFHKGIENRFTDKNADQDYRNATITAALDSYKEDYKEYIRSVKGLLRYIQRQNICNYESDLVQPTAAQEERGHTPYKLVPLTATTAKSMANRLHDQRISLLSRYPSHDEDDVPYDKDHPSGHYCGQYRDDMTIHGSPTFSRNAIIPLTVSLKLDGISGISPLNIFKISPDKLPKGYQDPNIIFVVKKLTEKITKNQDWTTELTGYISFLNDNPALGNNDKLLANTNLKLNLSKEKILNMQKVLEKKKQEEINKIISGSDAPDSPSTAGTSGYVMEKPFFDFNLLHLGVDSEDKGYSDFDAPKDTPGARKSRGYITSYERKRNDNQLPYRVFGENATHQNDWNPPSHHGQDLHAPKGTIAYAPVTGRISHHGLKLPIAGFRSCIVRCILTEGSTIKDGKLTGECKPDPLNLAFWGGHFDSLNPSPELKPNLFPDVNNDFNRITHDEFLKKENYLAGKSPYDAVRKIGDYINAGEFWGTVGNTGNAVGTHTHIHFNIYEHGMDWKKSSINPQVFIESVYPQLIGKINEGTNAIKRSKEDIEKATKIINLDKIKSNLNSNLKNTNFNYSQWDLQLGSETTNQQGSGVINNPFYGD